ncbi:hypothetical protein KVT40_001632 [Elsinoe batatas]|uniref:Uncharacterized protein n=1 Tax=Elsinoe batatas TaxID=2601811 RepID=A0A8K0PJY0_9PEZI|nr:hypothetical protein KVT40_001632 [Elsinoe batatas]
MSSMDGTSNDARDGDIANTLSEKSQSSTTLKRSSYLLVLAMSYSTLAIVAWSLICTLSRKPLTTNSYHDIGQDLVVRDRVFDRNEEWVRATRFLQALVTVLAIPMASAACSSAAVLFTQNLSLNQRPLSLRQLLVLADRGWSDPETITRFLRPGQVRKDWSRYGTRLLGVSILLALLSGITSPIQEVLVRRKAIRVHTGSRYLLTDAFDLPGQQVIASDNNQQTIVDIVRSELTTARLGQAQPQLWTGRKLECSASIALGMRVGRMEDGKDSFNCAGGGPILYANISMLPDPFLAELPRDTDTGLLRQFVPRINSSVSYTKVDRSEIAACQSQGAAVLGMYNGEIFDAINVRAGDYQGDWRLATCMPGSPQSSPWAFNRRRQDFQEVLHIDIMSRVWRKGYPGYNSTSYSTNSFRLTVDTTAGYFELPNYQNELSPGPLLDKSPSYPGEYKWPQSMYATEQDSPVNSTGATPHPGPLFTVATALFGPGSPLDLRIRSPDTYISSSPAEGTCGSSLPLTRLLVSSDGCHVPPTSSGELSRSLLGWIRTFDPGNKFGPEVSNITQATLINGLNIAAFIANKAWMMNSVDVLQRSRAATSTQAYKVYFDAGRDTIVPEMPLWSMIVGSVLLLLQLSLLLGVAGYSATKVRWTEKLDGWALLRLGVDVSDRVDLRVSKSADRITVLDDIDGRVGLRREGGTRASGTMRLGLGADGVIGPNKRVRCYDSDVVQADEAIRRH